MFYLLLAVYGTVLLSELLGDKSVYTISSLTLRFRPLSVFYGFTAAFMLKMLIAVLFGQIIAQLPKPIVALISAGTFFVTALIIWFKRSTSDQERGERQYYLSRGALLTFTAIVFSEWADIGQIMTATLTARYQLPLLVWLGATLALITKGLLALMLGHGLRKRFPMRMLRPVSASVCVLMGVISALGLARG
jgi:putative Ca2+/H+ antiporter (TMEM165/GDT1 family)